jgi:hypothetical protein
VLPVQGSFAACPLRGHGGSAMPGTTAACYTLSN